MSSVMNAPRPWTEANRDRLSKVRGICLDIDETLSTRGKLTSDAFAALWALKEAGFEVIPITGRPAGWCDMIARFWPVDAVVGENGAFSFFMKDGVRRRLDTLDSGLNAELKQKLTALSQRILERFPHARWASDQAYREYDLAIDFCEDVPAWPSEDIKALVELCHGQGAHAKVSSIHVNTWFGNYDKKTGFQRFLEFRGEWRGSNITGTLTNTAEWLFIGDSPNDEPMFEFFENSVGVANLNVFLKDLKHPPAWVTAGESGAGFVEMANQMVKTMNAARA